MEVIQVILDWTNIIEVHDRKATDKNLEPIKEENSPQKHDVNQNNHVIPGVPFH